VIKLVGSIVIPLAAGIMVLAPELIEIVYGEKWSGAIAPLQILCVFGGIRAIAAINGYLLNGIGKPKIDLYAILVRFAIIAILIYPMIVEYGLIGAAVVVTVGITVQFVLSTFAIKNILKMNLKPLIAILSKCLVYSIAMAGLLLIAKEYLMIVGVQRLLILTLFAACIYMVLNYRVLKPLLHKLKG
jgi:O-antigen/teichoic acid export membrane protein